MSCWSHHLEWHIAYIEESIRCNKLWGYIDIITLFCNQSMHCIFYLFSEGVVFLLFWPVKSCAGSREDPRSRGRELAWTVQLRGQSPNQTKRPAWTVQFRGQAPNQEKGPVWRVQFWGQAPNQKKGPVWTMQFQGEAPNQEKGPVWTVQFRGQVPKQGDACLYGTIPRTGPRRQYKVRLLTYVEN